jgi:uncharacterized RDD family membrane protein YckC
MDRSVSVRTPESIAFSYDLAGLGSRFLAVAIDMAIQTLVIVGIVWGIVAMASHTPGHPVVHRTAADVRAAQSLGIAIIAAVLFLVYFGYFILFEAFWNGQTPGKKLLHIRVVRDGGYPADIGSTTIRNLIRVGEIALGFYGVSAIVALFSPENKRLGDLAAGTMVVREERAPSLAAVVAAQEQQPAGAPSLLTPDEHALVDRYVARRETMAPSHRALLAAQIAARVRPRISRDLQALDDDDLLTKLSGW